MGVIKNVKKLEMHGGQDTYLYFMMFDESELHIQKTLLGAGYVYQAHIFDRAGELMRLTEFITSSSDPLFSICEEILASCGPDRGELVNSIGEFYFGVE